MVRLAAAVVALLILPSFAASQEQTQALTHTVVEGNTLWDLAASYYGDPYKWPVIFDANRDVVEDPHWIYPDEVLVIPGLDAPAEVLGVAVVPPVGLPVMPPVEHPDVAQAPPPLPPVSPGPGERTVFYRDFVTGQGSMLAAANRDYLTVPRAAVMSAPWLEAEEGEPPHSGTILGFSEGMDERGFRETARPYERLQVTLYEGVTLRIGDEFQTFRLTRREKDVGIVATPTGIVMVTRIEGDGAVTVVTDEYDRMRLGDYVRRAPRFDLVEGDYAEEVSSDLTATILGFGELHQIQSLGDFAFLDVGEPEGIEIGDEFIAIVNAEGGWTGEIGGTLQVVLVQGDHCSARVTNLTGPVFETGMTVSLARKMR